MPANIYLTALLLFGSGACALIYQTAWLREFRLNSALRPRLRLRFWRYSWAAWESAVIFWAGKPTSIPALADVRPPRNGIAAAAALTPILLWLARTMYISLGGSIVLGDALATLARLFLSAVVLGPATILMGAPCRPRPGP